MGLHASAAALALGCATAQAQFSQLTPPSLGSAALPADDNATSQDANANVGANSNPNPSGPARLRQSPGNQAGDAARTLEPNAPLKRYLPSEFERYVQLQSDLPKGQEIRRFGSDLVSDALLSSMGQDPLPSVPADYIVKPGDEIALTLWGTVDADLRVVVDRTGRIAVPRIGSVTVAGVRNADLADVIGRRVSQVFKNFQISVSLGQVRPVRVFVTGYAQRPGSLTVSGLASVLHVVMRAGGPSAAGSFRDIHLRRGGKEISTFDLYDLLVKGERGADQLVQPDDVIFIGPVGPQVGLIGSVNQQAVFELRPRESLADLLRMAGGFNAVADRTHVTIERLADRNTGRVTELPLPASDGAALGTGDLVRAFSAISAQLPKERQNKRVRVEGEVAHPGDYVLPPGSRVSDALRLAGGLTAAAYPFGTEFTRESVRVSQQENYDRALRDLETDIAKKQAGQRSTTADEASVQSVSAAAGTRLVERLRQVRPTGRVVLQIEPEATALPDLALEDGDQLTIPSRGTSVGVFGSVFNPGSFVFSPGHTTQDFLRLSGGPTRGADKGSMFLIRANGAVVSAQQDASFWRSSDAFANAVVEPGDTLFVPEELNKATFIQDAKDWTQVLYQFGLGLAGIKALGVGL